MWLSKTIAVVVPAYREERLIGRTLAGIPAWVDSIHVVDDASPDQTRENARAVGDPRVRLLSHPENQGVGAAIATGYRSALAARADVIVVMAGDNQMDPDDLAAVVTPIAEHRADYVKGNRFAHRERARMPRLRRLGGGALALLTRLSTGLDVTDTQCGYTAISGRVASLLPLDDLWTRYGYPNDLLGMLAARGFTVVEVSVRPVYAGEQSGIRPWHMLSIAGVIARRWRKERGTQAARVAVALLSTTKRP